MRNLAESTVHVLEEDDGSGWVKVADDSGGKGLVPASYIEVLEGAQTTRSATPSLGQSQPNVDYGTVSCPRPAVPCLPKLTVLVYSTRRVCL